MLFLSLAADSDLETTTANSDLGMETEPFQPCLAARLSFGRADSLLGPVYPLSANVTFVRKNGRVWRWELSPASYEYVHGLSLVAKQVPQKTKEAASVNLEKDETLKKEEDDDGLFLVDLVVNQAKFFREVAEAKRKGEEETLGERKKRVFWKEQGAAAEMEVGNYAPCDEEGEGGLDFEQTVLTFWRELLQFRTLLSKRAEKETLRDSDHGLLDFATDLLACCYAYLHFVYPVWTEVKKTGKQIGEEKKAAFCSNATSKIENCKQEMLLLRSKSAAEDLDL